MLIVVRRSPSRELMQQTRYIKSPLAALAAIGTGADRKWANRGHPTQSLFCSWKPVLFTSSNMAQIYQPAMTLSIWDAYSNPPPPSFPRRACPREVGGGNPSPARCDVTTGGAVCHAVRSNQVGNLGLSRVPLVRTDNSITPPITRTVVLTSRTPVRIMLS